MCLPPLDCWDYGFESCREHGCLFLVSVECCRLGVPASDRSSVQRDPTDCGVTECNREAETTTRPRPTRGCRAVDVGEKRGGGRWETWRVGNFCHVGIYKSVPVLLLHPSKLAARNSLDESDSESRWLPAEACKKVFINVGLVLAEASVEISVH